MMQRAEPKNVIETKKDLRLLLECLKCHMGDVSMQRDNLLTTASICSSSDEAKEFFRECGGINFVLNLLMSTKDDRVKNAGLYMLGCACDKNVFSQKRLCTTAIFKFLHCQLISEDQTSESLKRTSAFLLLCLVTNNGEGQNLARTSHCLDAFLELFRTLYSDNPPASSSHTWSGRDRASGQLDLWTTITSALCGCVNNPQNEENQEMCALATFPAAIAIIGKTVNLTIVRLVSSFLSLTIANNAKNQDRFGILGGLDVLVDVLHTVVQGLLRRPNQDAIQAAVQLANVFVSCITDSEQNHMHLVDLDLVSLLVQLLSMDFLESDVRLKLIITLGHVTEKCERSQRQLLENDGLSLLVHLMTENHDEEFNKATMYLLSSCVDIVSRLEAGGLDTDTEQSIPTQTRKNIAEIDKAHTTGQAHHTTNPQCNAQSDSKDSQEDDEHHCSSQTGSKNGQRNDEKRLCENKINESRLHRRVEKENIESILHEADSSPLHEESNQNRELEKNNQNCELEKSNQKREIDRLLKQLEEERRRGKLLQNEKESLERQIKAELRSRKPLAEALTKELERQYREQMEIQDQGSSHGLPLPETEGPRFKTLDKLLSPEVTNVEQKLDILEKKLHQFITNMGNQLADDLSTGGTGEGLIHSQSRPADPMSGPHRDAYSDACKIITAMLREKESHHPQRNVTAPSQELPVRMRPRQLSRLDDLRRFIQGLNDDSDAIEEVDVDAANTPTAPNRSNVFKVATSSLQPRQLSPLDDLERFIQGLNDDSDAVEEVDVDVANRPMVPSRSNVFKVPTSPLRLHKLGSSKRTCGNEAPSLCRSSIKMRRSSHHGHYHNKPDVDETFSDTDVSLSGSDLCLVKRAQSNRMDPSSSRTGTKPVHCQMPEGQSKAGRSFKVRLRPSEKGAARSVSSRPASLHKPAESQLRGSEDGASSAAEDRGSQISGVASSEIANHSASHGASKCPGCIAPINRPLLNSRNFLHTLEGSQHTCTIHQKLLKQVKQDIQQRRLAQTNDKSPESTRSTRSHSTRKLRSASRRNPVGDTPSPPFQAQQSRYKEKLLDSDSSSESDTPSTPSQSEQSKRKGKAPSCVSTPSSKRRKRQDFTPQEVQNLIKGVLKKGRHWNNILWAYNFAPGRTGVDLKDKYRRMQAQNHPGVIPASPSSTKSSKHNYKGKKRDCQWRP